MVAEIHPDGTRVDSTDSGVDLICMWGTWPSRADGSPALVCAGYATIARKARKALPPTE